MVSYVLSTYLTPPAPRAFTTRRHDQCVALWRKTRDRIVLARYWELERLSGRKHHEMPLYGRDSPRELVTHLLGREGLAITDLEAVWGTPGLELDETLPPIDSRGLPLHSLAHLFSGLGMDSARFSESLIIALAMDGGPDFTLEDGMLGDNWYAGAVARQGDVTLYPIESPGPLWQHAEHLLGMEPGTLMALAQATPAVIDFDPAILLAERYWGGYALMVRCFDLVYSIIAAAERDIKQGTVDANSGFSREELMASAVMKVIQAASIAIAKRNVDLLLDRAGNHPADTYLSLSGGYALNCPTNSELVSSYGFRGLLTPPCPNDSGQALGIGLMGFYAGGDLRTHRVETRLPFAGEIARTCQARARWGHRILDEVDFDPAVFAADLLEHPVAWVDGPAEVGPRALGHRSLLGDPAQPRTKEILNRVKRRQWWRPVAPIVLEEHAADWFHCARRSPFMLETFRVREDRQDRIPAALHLDGSARIQTLARPDDERLYLAVSAFHAETGVPVVCNTSLNDRGEPIANDAAEAVNFCLRRGIKVAYIGGRRLALDVERVIEVAAPEPRPLHDMYANQPERPSAIYGEDADPQLLFLLYLWPGLHRLAAAPGGADRMAEILAQVRKRETAFPRRAELFLAYWRGLLDGSVKEGAADAA